MQLTGIVEKQNGKTIDSSAQKINFILHEGGKKWKGKAEGTSQCLDQLHQYSEAQCAFNSQGYSIVLYKVHLGRYLGVMEKDAKWFQVNTKMPSYHSLFRN